MKQGSMLALILLLLGSAVTGAAPTAHCPHCLASEPQQATAEGNQKGFSVALQVIADEILRALGSSSPLTALLPTISAERIGSIDGAISVGRCDGCCAEPSPRLAVIPIIESQGIAESLLPDSYAHPSPRTVSVEVIGPTILDARTPVERSTASAMDRDSAPWEMSSHFTIRGQSTIIRFDFWGLFSAAIQAAQESDQVETSTNLIEWLGGKQQMRITETWIGDVVPHCTCVGDGEQEILETVNQAPQFKFQNAITIAIPGTTVIAKAFTGSDPDGDPLYIVLSGHGLPPDVVDYFVDPETGTMTITVGDLDAQLVEGLVHGSETKKIYVYDLRLGASVVPGEYPAEGDYYHESYQDVYITYSVDQPPVARSIEQTKSIQELRTERGEYQIRAIFGAADGDPHGKSTDRLLGFRVREGQDLAGWIQHTPRLDPRTGSGLLFWCPEDNGSEAICYSEALFEYQDGHGGPPPPGKYVIEFEVYKMIQSTGETWGFSTGTFTLTVTNDAPVAVEDRYENIRLYQSCGYAEIITGSVLANDYDINGDRLEVHDEGASSDVPVFGVANVVIPLSEPIRGALLLERDGSFVYTIDPEHPDGNWFTYRVRDERGGLSNPAVVELVVNPTSSNHPPSLAVTKPSIHESVYGERLVLFAASIGDVDLDCDDSSEILRIAIETDLENLEIFKDQSWIRLNDVAPFTINRLATLASRTLDNGIELPIRGVIPAGRKTSWLEVRVTDLAGEAAGERLVFNSGNWSPETLINNEWVSAGNASFDGMVLSIGPSMFTMDPAWYEAGCLQFRDLDGDALIFRMTQFPRWGTANLMTSGSGGNYFVTVMYEIDREAMLTCHRDRRDLVDQLTVQTADPYGGVSEATMNIRFDVVNSPPVC
ncbi:hypothetical protein KKG90_00305, partial [Candidatus Bipolaricaulota bacterium]|nr:hypothetical protein [Candidatus Bipolaricaulota bacterium]